MESEINYKSISFILTIILWPLNDSFELSDNHLTPIMHLRVEHVKHGGIWIYWIFHPAPFRFGSFIAIVFLLKCLAHPCSFEHLNEKKK